MDSFGQRQMRKLINWLYYGVFGQTTYLACPEIDTEIDKLAVLLHQVFQSALFQVVMGLFLQLQAGRKDMCYSKIYLYTDKINDYIHPE